MKTLAPRMGLPEASTTLPLRSARTETVARVAARKTSGDMGVPSEGRCSGMTHDNRPHGRLDAVDGPPPDVFVALRGLARLNSRFDTTGSNTDLVGLRAPAVFLDIEREDERGRGVRPG